MRNKKSYSILKDKNPKIIRTSLQDVSKKAVILHRKFNGKISITSKFSINSSNLPLVYTPGVAAVSKEIFNHPNYAYLLTSKANNVAIVTDGTRVLGLGKIGASASIPVMEGKSVLYKKFGGVDAFPLCLKTTKKSDIISVVEAIEPVFGAINLEDIESPKVFDITNELEKRMKIPIFHDDRHGTSVVVLAGLLNSLKLVKKELTSIKIIIGGAGSAGYGIFQLLRYAGCHNIIIVDSKGIIYKGRSHHMNKYKKEIANLSNQKRIRGTLSDALQNADVFIGVTGIKDLLTPSMIKNMNRDPIIFALTNPEPEIIPSFAKKAGARIIATGSYLYPNRVNNSIVFPYVMRAILDFGITRISLKLLKDTAEAIANSISRKELDYEHIIPDVGNRLLQKNISKIIAKYKK